MLSLPYFSEWELGMIKTWIRPEGPASGLVPPDCISPAVWQRSFGKDTGGGGMWKVKYEYNNELVIPGFDVIETDEDGRVACVIGCFGPITDLD